MEVEASNLICNRLDIARWNMLTFSTFSEPHFMFSGVMANTFLGNIAAAELWNGDSSAGIPLSGDVLIPCSIKKHKNAAGFYYEEK